MARPWGMAVPGGAASETVRAIADFLVNDPSRKGYRESCP